MPSPVTAFWSLVDVARKAAEWSPGTLNFGWRTEARIQGKPWWVFRAVSLGFDEGRLAMSPYVTTAPMRADSARSWGKQLPPDVREAIRGYRAKWHRRADKPHGWFVKDVRTIDELAAEISRIEGPQLTIPVLRSDATEGAEGFWNATDCFRLTTRLAPELLFVEANRRVSAFSKSWKVEAFVRLAAWAPGMHPPLTSEISMRAERVSEALRKKLVANGFYRRFDERLAKGGFHGDWKWNEEERSITGNFKWSSWDLSETRESFKSVDRTYRAIVGSLK